MNIKISDPIWSSTFRCSHFPSALLDPSFIIVACNHAYEELVGRPLAELVGSSFFTLFPGESPAQQLSIRASFAHVRERGESHHLPLVEYDLSGDTRFWAMVNTPLLDEQGGVHLVLTQPTDITELTRLREELNPFSPTLVRCDANPSVDRVFRLEQVQQILSAERKRLEQMFQQAPGFVCILRGVNHVYEMANAAYYQLVGHRDIIGHELADVLPEVVPQGFLDKLDNVYLTGIPIIGRAVPIELRRTRGAELEQSYVDLMCQPIRDGSGRISGIFVQGHDVTEAYRLSLEVAYQAVHDPLTGLANRRMLARVGETLEAGDTNHALLYLDLDHFKIINDRCGHSAGDELLVQITEVLASFIGNDDTLARIGGDEFVLVLKDCAEFVALEISNQIRHAVQDLIFVWGNRRYGITLSVGLVSFGTHKNIGFEQALSLADSACFLAKEKGRNRVQMSKPDDDDVHRQQTDMDWASRIREAIADDRIALWGQRIVPLSGQDHQLCVEVLARMMAVDGEVIPPGAFIPAAERFGMVEQLDYHILRKVFEYLDSESTLDGELLLFVNLSGTTLSSQDFSETINAIAAEFPQVPASQVCFEVTETSAITNLARAAEAMRSLVASGFTFALDDFGSGMSSFSYLERLPVAYIKIDGEFIQSVDTHIAGEAIIESVTKVARTMGIVTIAEYVERREQIPVLTKLGVDRGQGYGIHRPEPLGGLSSASYRNLSPVA